MTACLLCEDQGAIVTTSGRGTDRLTANIAPCSCEKGKSLSDWWARTDPMYALPEIVEADRDRQRYS